MERMYCSLNDKTSTKFVCVRYGNVAWSTGSVLPIWSEMLRKTGVIKTTGKEMRRFFFTVDEAVELVCTALDNIQELQGKVLSRQMKSARMGDILEVWVQKMGGKWEEMIGRPGERLDEYLIGELELPFTSQTIFNDIQHYVISFNQKSENPFKTAISSANAEKLNEKEIWSILSNPPAEEIQ